MDFFSAHHVPRPPSAATSPSSSLDPFAQEIGRRFSLPQAQPAITARLSPMATSTTASATTTTTTTATSSPPSLAAPQARLVSLSLRSQASTSVRQQQQQHLEQQHHQQHHQQLHARLTVVDPNSLLPVLATPDILVLDIRPHATFAQSRLPHALSLSVPSTLLKRPAFSLGRLTEMLPSSSGRRRFSAWKSASRILVYDADSHHIPETSNILGLLRKFKSEGFRGDLAWLKGGFAGVWREQRTIVDDGPPSPDSSEEEDAGGGYLRAKKLPSSAFQQVSTTTAAQRPSVGTSAVQHKPVAPAPTSTRPVAANPFYDNIRQNRELEHGITQRIPLRLPAPVIARRDHLPFDWLKEIVDKADAEEGTEALAMQFYMIELREQRRLMGVMDHHTREASSALNQCGTTLFPYSITAGVEKGSKNRYTNIWPFEHARVRLKSSSVDDGSDYINASHVQPLGTRRRYIATQGPLPTTFSDFWSLCWEQNIRIIVMLTKQVEGSTEKCSCYWKQTSYGSFRLELVSSSGVEESEVNPPAPHPGFDFGMSSCAPESDKATVRRIFRLSHTGHPEQPPREIIHLQHLAWPDYDVPEDPRGLLDLMREVDILRSEVDLKNRHPDAIPAPVLLHCSAGIGRTGGFIVADAALDGIRREMRKRRAGGQRGEVDANVPSSFLSQTPLTSGSRTLTASPSPMELDGMETETRRTRDSSSVSRASMAISMPSRGLSLRRSHREYSATDTSAVQSDDSRTPSLSPGPSVPGPASGASSGSGLRPSAFVPDMELRMPSPQQSRITPRGSFVSLQTEPEPALPGSAAGALSRFRLALVSRPGEASASTSTTHLPSVFSASLPLTDKSTVATSSFPVSVESSRSPSPAKDAEQIQSTTTFDYTDPRCLHNNSSPEPLSSYPEPVRSLLEDMREQRMSLCQSLRQYVFVHRAIVEGALDIVDEELRLAQQDDGPINGKRGPSPTELLMEDKGGAVRLTKRPSFKRTERNDTSNNAGSVVVP